MQECLRIRIQTRRRYIILSTFQHLINFKFQRFLEKFNSFGHIRAYTVTPLDVGLFLEFILLVASERDWE